MAVKTLFGADQDAAIVQAEALISEVNAAGYGQVRDLVTAHTRFRFEPWTAAMREAVADALATITTQSLADDDYNVSNATVRRLVDACNAWRTEGHQAVELAVQCGWEGAAEAAEELVGLGATIESYVEQRTEIRYYLAKVERLNHEALDLTEDFVARGRALVQTMSAERSDADAAKGTREVETSDLSKALDRIAKLAEQYAAARALASTRSTQELPGFDLTYIRAAAAPKPAAPRAGEVEADKGL